ncbi:MAG: hypothetical protein IKH63_15450 [Prevotella sp.]|nr:hypothetical protein [Prevotella sp.]
MLTLRLVGEDSDILESVIDALFLVCLNYHNQISNQGIAEVNATGVCIYSRSVPRANYALTHTFRVYYILTSVGIQILFIPLERAVVGLNTRMGR